jgi:hypothetical protein
VLLALRVYVVLVQLLRVEAARGGRAVPLRLHGLAQRAEVG